MGRMAMAGMAVCALACTSVHMVQRDGCWMKKTESTFGGSREELGFCARPQPEWAQDRLARLVQECMAQADYRWENRAIAAWTRNEPIPPQETDAEITKACMGQATQALGLEAQNQELRARMAELGQDREALKTATEKDRQFLENSSDKLVTALGEAAKRPPPTATATATSTGTAKTESEQRSAGQEPAPVRVIGVPQQSAAPACTPKKTNRKTDKPQCEKGPETAAAALPPKAG